MAKTGLGIAILLVCWVSVTVATQEKSFLWMYTSEPGPQQVHLTILGDDSVGVTWATLGDHASGDGIVKYGEAEGKYPLSIKATSVSRQVKDWKGKFHYAALRDLKPSTRYYYVVGDPETKSYSEVYSFLSPPKAGVAVSFKLAAVGSMGTSGDAGNTVKRLEHIKESLSMVLHTGGLSYAERDPTKWDEWATAVEPVAAAVPYMVSVGMDVTGDDGYADRFMLPVMASGSPTPYYYSYNYGTVHFIAISTEHSHDKDSDQYKWLENDLREATKVRGANRWIVVFGNQGMYSSSTDHKGDSSVREGLEEMFHKYKVDVCIWGGEHFYERTYPVMHGDAFVSEYPHRYVNPKGIVHLAVGNAGSDLHADFELPQPKWSAYREASFGYVTMQVLTNDTLHVEYRKDEDDSVGDRVWIVKTGRSSAPWTQHIFASSMLPRTAELVSPPPVSSQMSPVGVSVIVAVAVVSVFLSAVLTVIALSSSSWFQARAAVPIEVGNLTHPKVDTIEESIEEGGVTGAATATSQQCPQTV